MSGHRRVPLLSSPPGSRYLQLRAAEGRPAGVTAGVSAINTAAAVLSAGRQPAVRMSCCRIPGNNLQLFTTRSQRCSHQTAAGLCS